MLRSVKKLYNYVLEAEDGEISRCKNFLFDDEHWTVRYMVADTGKWLPGRKVLVAPVWINSIDWAENRVNIDLTTEAVKNSPEYDPSAPVNREYEVQLYDFYGRPKYWD
ncbi:MAG: hypothetical protein U9N83_18340 [Thermodesulfobacteriota bacterium]|nr:hypothetical protein [Thermodesulfobacteriota bacterium]